jgi:hypothetical protein
MDGHVPPDQHSLGIRSVAIENSMHKFLQSDGSGFNGLDVVMMSSADRLTGLGKSVDLAVQTEPSSMQVRRSEKSALPVACKSARSRERRDQSRTG